MQPESSDSCLIPLTKGLSAIVDAADYLALSAYKWRVSGSKKTADGRQRTYYAVRFAGPHHHRGDKRPLLWMHRAILGLPGGQHPEVDHINGNGLDNRRCNLRAATTPQNAANTYPPSNNKSGYKGVSLITVHGVWVANIRVNGQPVHLGRFLTAEDAARAYDAVALQHYGEFARLNLPLAVGDQLPQRGDRTHRLHPERLARGEQHGHAKLTEADVRAIRNSSELLKVWAERLHVNESLISQIRRRIIWRHVE